MLAWHGTGGKDARVESPSDHCSSACCKALWHHLGCCRPVRKSVVTSQQQAVKWRAIHNVQNRRHFVHAKAIARNRALQLQVVQCAQPAVHELREVVIIGRAKAAPFQIVDIDDVDPVKSRPGRAERARPQDRIPRIVEIDSIGQQVDETVVWNAVTPDRGQKLASLVDST
jgi:hypothetical protein